MQLNMNSFKLKGHRSFYLRDGWINKGLMNVSAFHSEYPVDELGVGDAMVYAIRYYLETMELIDSVKVSNKKNYFLTEKFGEIINKYDRYLEDDFTIWLLHYKFVKNIEEATSFNIFFNLFDYEEFTKNELNDYIYNIIEKQNLGKAISKKSIKSDVDCIIKNYNISSLNEKATPEENFSSPFIELGLLSEKDRNSERIYMKNKPDFSTLNEYVLYYVMLEQIGDKESISIENLLCNINNIGKIFNLDRYLINEYLDKLEKKELIVVNRTAGLNQVYINKIPLESVLDQYYNRGEVVIDE